MRMADAFYSRENIPVEEVQGKGVINTQFPASLSNGTLAGAVRMRNDGVVLFKGCALLENILEGKS
ncbi:MAG: hypothetical protein QXO02_08620 [Thermofilaceae archaeon]